MDKPTHYKDVFGNLWESQNWLCWRYSNGRKVPMDPNSTVGSIASVDDSSTWSDGKTAEARSYAESYNGIGWVFTSDGPLVGIDLDDCRNPKTGDIEPKAREIVEKVGSYTEVSPSGTGLTIMVRGSIERSGYKDNEEGIEVYQSRRYFAITLDDPGIGGIGGTEIIESPDGLGWLVDTYFPDREFEVESSMNIDDTFESDTLMEPDDWVPDALQHISPDCPYSQWIAVGMALHHGYEGSQRGFELWREWSKEGEKFEENQQGEMKNRWERSFGNHSGPDRTLKTVWKVASDNGWEFDSGIDREDIDRAIEEMKESEDGTEPDTDSEDTPAESESGLSLRWHSYGSIVEDDSPLEDYLVDPGIIGAKDTVMLFSPPKTGKSMMCLDQCAHWAAGKSWMDLEPNRPLKIAMLNFELKYDSLRRRRKLLDHDQFSEEEIGHLRKNLWVTDRFYDTLDKEFVTDVYKSFKRVSKDLEPDILVVDPLVNIFPGDSENSNAEAMDFINALRVLAQSLNPSCALYLVHHTSKMAREERLTEPFRALRGAGALRGAYDTGIALNYTSEQREKLQVQFECRNSEGIDPFYCKFDDGTFKQVEHADTSSGDPQQNAYKTIVNLLEREADKGNVYIASTFANRWTGVAGLPSARSIRRMIHELASKHVIGYGDCSQWGEKLHNRSAGHLVTRNMQLHLHTNQYGERTLVEASEADQHIQAPVDKVKTTASSDPVPVEEAAERGSYDSLNPVDSIC